jgi:membrane protease YdiL (CAAX protease family)
MEELWGGAFFLIGPFLLMIGSLGLWVRLFERRPFSTAGFRTQRLFRNYLTGLAIGFVTLAATIGMMALTGAVEFDTETAQPGGVILVLGVLLMLLGFLVQGGAEEILIRGWFFQVLGARYAPWVGLAVSTIVFAAFHGSTSIMANLNLILFAVFLAFYYLYEGSIWGAMGWHSAWNWAQSNVFGVTLSGTMESEHTLMNLRTSGSPLLSGGDFGPEASLFCTLVFLIGLMVLAVLSRRKGVVAVKEITNPR